MKSFCIKTNNGDVLNYLLDEFQNIDMEKVYISKNKFKHYRNIIIHYRGKMETLFNMKVSNSITKCIIKFYEVSILKKIINSDFFYFDQNDKEDILENSKSELLENDSTAYLYRSKGICESVYKYVSENKFFILEGFVNFRLFEYRSLLEQCVETAVNKFIIDKEYAEFIGLLQGYINTQENKSNINLIHLIYTNSEPILLDEKQNIHIYNKLEQPKYLSDITFSSNDYCLNALLNLAPKRLVVHLLSEEDEFIETLKLIFGRRLTICKECNICRTFALINVKRQYVSENGILQESLIVA